MTPVATAAFLTPALLAGRVGGGVRKAQPAWKENQMRSPCRCGGNKLLSSVVQQELSATQRWRHIVPFPVPLLWTRRVWFTQGELLHAGRVARLAGEGAACSRSTPGCGHGGCGFPAGAVRPLPAQSGSSLRPPFAFLRLRVMLCQISIGEENLYVRHTRNP